MLSWLRQFDGYEGLLIMADEEAGTARIATFWESRETAERSAHGRKQVREKMAMAAGVDLEGVELLEVVLTDGF